MVIEGCRIEKWRMFPRQMQKKTKEEEEEEPNLRSSAPLQLLFAKLFSLAPSTFQTVQNEKREREREQFQIKIYIKKTIIQILEFEKNKKTKERGYTTLLFYLQFIYQLQFTIWDFSRD